MNKQLFFLVIFVFTLSGEVLAQKIFRISERFSDTKHPPAPDYSNISHWAALPIMKDMADSTPINSGLSETQNTAKADVFFLHPTIFTAEPANDFIWNADVNDSEMNIKVDNSTILNQATAFNGACKVYAPRYRQAHYTAFTTDDENSADSALDLAYLDIKAAFEYYLKNFNEGRPIVIASHSQGTVHAGRLLKEFFDGKELQNQLVEAYLIGIATPGDYFETIQPSDSPEHTGGFVTWNTFVKGFYPNYYNDGLNKAICTNPLSWRVNEEYVPRTENLGGVGLKYKFYKQPVDAQVHDGMLWISKPHVPGRIFIRSKIWHRADINLYWMNIRENVALRVSTFLTQNKAHEQ
ncbi:DUF3089 domain-containing protein [Jiulongibacter sp. NS-SX5]|uniref:DUF3089 domain-containing protein n=1 Tax=Jiulongibacter sp. NS-SX5 TaxID=3463854 RepID=UPI004059B4F0